MTCGLSLLDEGFDPSSLVYWCRRIVKSVPPRRVDDAVATQDTITQLIGAIRRVARQAPGAAEVELDEGQPALGKLITERVSLGPCSSVPG